MHRLSVLLALLAVAVLLGLAAAACRDEIQQVAPQQQQQASATQPEAADQDQPAERPSPSVARTDQSTAQQAQAQAEQAEVEYEEAEQEEQAAAEQAEEEAEQAAGSDALADEGERSDTGTNIQVVGVDEPDVIKTDGAHLYVLDSDQLTIIAIDEDGLELRGELTFGTPATVHVLGHQQLLLSGDTVLALRRIGFDQDAFWNRWNSTARWEWLQWWFLFQGEAQFRENIIPPPLTQLVEIDVSDPANPWVRRVLEVEADLLGARLVDSSARILLRARSAALAPRYSLCEYEPTAASDDGECDDPTTAPLIDAGDTHRFGRTGQTNDALAVLLTFDLADAGLGRWGSLGVATEGSDATVYATVRSLYVAQLDPGYGRTEIHRFDLGDPMSPRAAGSEFARGRLINQFALSEYRGHLRVATTIEDVWPTESVISVYELSETSMRWVSSLNGLGTTELIHAVRFMGERGFVVTFRQIDPLYIVDLSDPQEPYVAGELKLPGYSRYLHPLGGGRLLGVGQDADPATGWPVGLQLSLFDVSDSHDPRLLDQLKPAPEHVGPVRGWPEIDHRAFSYHEGVAYVPALLLNDHDWSGVGHVYAVAVSCDELSLMDTFGGEDGAFPVRVIPLGDRLFVLSWSVDGFLLQQFSQPSRIAVAGRHLEQDRIRVFRGADEGVVADSSECG